MSKYAPRYFKIDWDVASNDWEYILSIRDVDNKINQDNILFNIGASYKIFVNDLSSSVYESSMYEITSYPFINISNSRQYWFCYIPVYLPKEVAGTLGITKYGFLNFEDIIEVIHSILNNILGIEVNLSMEGITEITEDEYYKID